MTIRVGVIVSAAALLIIWFGQSLWEVDRTQDHVTATLTAHGERLGYIEQNDSSLSANLSALSATVRGLETLVEVKSSDRFTGGDADNARRIAELEHMLIEGQVEALRKEVENLYRLFRGLHDSISDDWKSSALL